MYDESIFRTKVQPRRYGGTSQRSNLVTVLQQRTIVYIRFLQNCTALSTVSYILHIVLANKLLDFYPSI